MGVVAHDEGQATGAVNSRRRTTADGPLGAAVKAQPGITERPRARNFNRRTATGLLGAAALLPWIGPAVADGQQAFDVPAFGGYPLLDEVAAVVNPSTGYRSRIVLWDSLQRLIRHGVLDRERFLAAEGAPNQTPKGWSEKLNGPSLAPIFLTRANAAHYVDLLWPIGLANRIVANAKSPLLASSLTNFASTGGWTLGQRQNGAVYFNKFAIVDMTPEQEALAVRVAKATFRPCCDNSTFFQDCNHGSALFGVLQLGAAQGLDERALFKEALAFNSFWFPDTYTSTALYFKAVRNTDWSAVDPKLVMGADFSTASGWQKNVSAPLAAIPDLLPPPSGGVNCGT